ncbi:MAG: efflux RND transporter periplasmic adaptor subunit [Gammaproteobacteria bacterium]|nr:efflux RND transporter periplasmic adaptor subunit [Gammaproteobacteria bacterium]
MSLLRPTAVLGAVLMIAACSEPPSPTPATRGAAGADLTTIAVQAEGVPRETAFDGTIEAVNQATVAAQTSGRVVELPFDVGDYVEQNQIIARLTSSEQSARVAAAEGSLAEAEARLAEAQLAYQRTRDVYDKKLVAKAQFDTAAANLDSARARVEAAQAALREAREGLGYTVVHAPYAGIVAARHVQLGETVTPGKILMTGMSLEHLRVVVEIPQQNIGPLREHRKARIILPDGRSLTAGNLRIPPGAEPATHTFRVLVPLPEGDHGVFPGTLVKVAFVSGEDKHLLIPAAALVRRGEVTGVYIVDQAGSVSLRYLRTATPDPLGRVPVLAGVVAGERVATDIIAAGVAYRAQLQPTGER